MSLIDPVVTIYKDASDIPEKVWDTYPRSWSKNLGEPVSILFPVFANAFPSTSNAMELYWSRPVLRSTIHAWKKKCLCDIYCIQGDKTLFMNPNAGTDENQTGWLFDQNAEMLPPRWKELYRWFDSFYLVEGRDFHNSWINSMHGFANRWQPEDYAEKIGASKSTVKALERFIDSTEYDIRCWLYTEAGDALFLDEARNDHKVYHVNKGNIQDIAVLPNAEDKLDEYLAHYVSGGLPKDFSFR